MKTALIILFLLIIAFIILLFILGVISRSGKAPGLVNEILSKCANRPNCVCSEQKDDVSHYIDPITIPQHITFDTLPILKSIIRYMEGSVTLRFSCIRIWYHSVNIIDTFWQNIMIDHDRSKNCQAGSQNNKKINHQLEKHEGETC